MKYKKKPLEVDAVQWEGTMESLKDITDLYAPTRPWEDCIRNVDFNSPIDFNEKTMSLYIHTTEGIMEAPKGWFIIKGVEDEFYPCKPSVFYKTYEPIEKIKIYKYTHKMLKNNNLPEGVYVTPSEDGMVITVPTLNGEEVVNEGDYIISFPNGPLRKVGKGTAEYERLKGWEEKGAEFSMVSKRRP